MLKKWYFSSKLGPGLVQSRSNHVQMWNVNNLPILDRVWSFIIFTALICPGQKFRWVLMRRRKSSNPKLESFDDLFIRAPWLLVQWWLIWWQSGANTCCCGQHSTEVVFALPTWSFRVQFSTLPSYYNRKFNVAKIYRQQHFFARERKRVDSANSLIVDHKIYNY